MARQREGLTGHFFAQMYSRPVGPTETRLVKARNILRNPNDCTSGQRKGYVVPGEKRTNIFGRLLRPQTGDGKTQGGKIPAKDIVYVKAKVQETPGSRLRKIPDVSGTQGKHRKDGK